NLLGGIAGGATGGAAAAIGGAATGAQFVVPGGGGTDSKLAAFRVTPGEMVTVTPKDKGTPGGAVINITHHNDFRGASAQAVAELRAQQELLARVTEARLLERMRSRRV